ncbi:MAG TPA: acetate/propionate family kinase [Puia sp.]|nr:acetate/propionate family kinase [Puia sp.]
MNAENKNILAVNGGSSSIKFSVYEMSSAGRPAAGDGHLWPGKWLTGKIDRIGQGEEKLTFTDNRNKDRGDLPVAARDLSAAGGFLLDWLKTRADVFPLAAVGHRIVHGGRHTQACLVDDPLLDELDKLSVYDPDHLPGEIALIRLIRGYDPKLPQIACFDTAFHAGMPRLAKLLPIPRRYERAGMQRYGFHGLSYAYILEELTRIAGAEAAGGSVIIAHLGNGASLAAIKDGVSVDTTMGFTPTGGIVMGTRPGDLDPGVIWAILNHERYDPEQLDHFLNRECGLLGLSETSADMRELLASEGSDTRAAEAVGLFCYQVKKAIGAFTAVLGGLDVLVFTGGIGERSAAVRSRICTGLGYLGIELDQRANAADAVSLSRTGTRTSVYAIPTDEESMIAQTVKQLL